MAKALGGRIAEEVVYGRDHITSGASSDLRQATSIARDMIIEQGMGTKLRDQSFHEDRGWINDGSYYTREAILGKDGRGDR